MSDERELIFVESHGKPPPPETIEAKLLHACSVDDEELWRSLGLDGISERELERAVYMLRRLGWEFYYEAKQ